LVRKVFPRNRRRRFPLREQICNLVPEIAQVVEFPILRPAFLEWTRAQERRVVGRHVFSARKHHRRPRISVFPLELMTEHFRQIDPLFDEFVV